MYEVRFHSRANSRLRQTLCAVLIGVALLIVETQAQQPADDSSPLPPQIESLLVQVKAAPLNAEARDAARAAGFEYLHRGNFSEAAQVFKRLTGINSGDARSIYGHALALFNLRRLDEAETTIKTITKHTSIVNQVPIASPLKADALVLLGVIRAVRGDNAGALNLTLQAVALAPDNFDAQFALGRARYSVGDPASAATAFQTAIKLSPKDVRARFFLATALEESGQTPAALAAYRELVQLAPHRADGYLGLGVLLTKQTGGQTAEGIEALKRAVELNGDSYEARVTLGRTLVRTRRAAESIEHLQRAAELAPKNPEPRYQLAIAYRALGKKVEADEQSRLVKQIHEARRKGTGEQVNALTSSPDNKN